MIKENGKRGFGEVFKVYGDALDIITSKQRELSTWKGETTELVKPLNQVDIVELKQTVLNLQNDFKNISNKFNLLSVENKTIKNECENIRSEYRAVKKSYCEVKEENEKLKEDLEHVQELTDIISFTCSKECSELKNNAKKKVLTMLGGSVTDDRYKLFYKKYIMNLYGYIKKEIGVSSIDKIPTAKLELAKMILARWQPTPVFKTKLITDLREDTTPDKNGDYRVKQEVVNQFNSLMTRFDDPVKFM